MICGSKGPRIGSQGTPRCARPYNHTGLHRGYPGSGFEKIHWANPRMQDLDFVATYTGPVDDNPRGLTT